eukprot:767061-Hanusia_phi.AAC.2
MELSRTGSSFSKRSFSTSSKALFAGMPQAPLHTDDVQETEIDDFSAWTDSSNTVQRMPAAISRIRESVRTRCLAACACDWFAEVVVSEHREVQTWALEGKADGADEREDILLPSKQRQAGCGLRSAA